MVDCRLLTGRTAEKSHGKVPSYEEYSSIEDSGKIDTRHGVETPNSFGDNLQKHHVEFQKHQITFATLQKH
jgi:hypothetical protein